MNSREKILSNVSANMPAKIPLMETPIFLNEEVNLIQKFSSVAVSIGSKVIAVNSYEEIEDYISRTFDQAQRIASPLKQLSYYKPSDFQELTKPDSFKDIDLAIIDGHFGVAENGSIWVTEEIMGRRIVPFITQHLAIILPKKQICNLMHEAYDRIGKSNYEYGCFIAGPSKTADIEQSLVLGAHGPRSLTIFLY